LQLPASALSTAGVRLADGRVFRGKTIISNATRWDTFEGMMGESKMPESEKLFRWECTLCYFILM
jgi:prolycopene isomerase